MDPLEFGAEEVQKKGSPMIVATHVGFRGLALFIYWFGSIFSGSFVTKFVFILLCLAADFWAVKNVTGRLLVGLRWRNQVDPVTGNSTWVYESRSAEGFKAKPVLQNESNIFWGALIICPILWVFFAFMSLLSPSWFIVCITAAAFNGANLYGYIRCKFGAMDNIKAMANKVIGTQLLQKFMSSGASQTAAAGQSV